MNGIISLIKPPRMSSAQAVSFVKRLTREKAGHAGTLDPEAAGVLPIMVGRATRLFDYLTDREKVYVTQIAFGVATDTQDATGKVTERGGDLPDEGRLAAVLPRFTGTVMQAPPAFSALKRDGETLYKLARRGQPVSTQPRPVEIASIKLLRRIDAATYTLRVVCGRGTYIRTLCHDIGRALGCPAHMRLLVREQSGPYRIEAGIRLEDLAERVNSGAPEDSYLTSMEDALSHLPRAAVSDGWWRPLINGAALGADALTDRPGAGEGEAFALYCGKVLIGIYALQGGKVKPRVLLYQAAGRVS